jgi:hypothetical protein
MAVDIGIVEDRADTDANHLVGRRRHRRWPLAVLAVVAFGVSCAYVAGNETQATTQFDRAHHVLTTTTHRTGVTARQLSLVRRNLAVLDGQITVSKRALAGDAAQLQSVNAALARARADDSQQASYIDNLKVCQSGVQQALNALAVGDQGLALAALSQVSAACGNVASSDG